MVTKLKTYGELRAFAVGPRGEMSPDLRNLVESMAEKAAESRWLEIGAKSILAARGTLKSMFVNIIGFAAVRANAQMLEDRLGLALVDGKSATARRKWAEQDAAEARFEYCRYHAKNFENTPPHRACGSARH